MIDEGKPNFFLGKIFLIVDFSFKGIVDFVSLDHLKSFHCLIGAHERVQSCLEFIRRITRLRQSFLSMFDVKMFDARVLILTNKIYQI